MLSNLALLHNNNNNILHNILYLYCILVTNLESLFVESEGTDEGQGVELLQVNQHCAEAPLLQ
jgi:hypothetical protein